MKKALIIFILFSIIASGINYLAYPILGRLLPNSEYIDITISLSFLTQITTFLSSIIAITIGLTKDKKNDETNIIEALQAILFRLFLGLALAMALLSPYIFNAIGIPILFLIPLVLIMLVSLPLTIVSGYLNGKGLLVKLGLVAVISASLQLTIGATVGYFSQSGFLTVLSMSIAQIIAICFIYYVFKREKLPSPFGIFTIKKESLAKHPELKRLVIYTALASLAIMAVSLSQVLDLVIINAQTPSGSKFYTDIYVVSRMVFFAGMIFVWPFLSEISLQSPRDNLKPVLKLLGFFTLITVSVVAILALLGAPLIYFLFGVWYEHGDVFVTGSLSVVYKFMLLVITAITLYFIVFRSKYAIFYALLASGALFTYSSLHDNSFSTVQIITHMVIISGLATLIGVCLITKHIYGTRQKLSPDKIL